MTNASNVGIDKHSVALQVRFEWPCNLLTYFQERGRGSRLQGAQSTCIVYGDLTSYVYLRRQLFAAGNNDDNTSPSTNDCDGYNSAISPRKTSRGQPITKKTYPLGPTGRHRLQERTTIELQEVISFFCLDLGCQHARGESYLAMGILNTTTIKKERCDNLCAICTKRWHEQFLPVYRSGVIGFLDFLTLTEEEQ